MEQKIKRAGKGVFIGGMVLLILGILLAFTAASMLTPRVFFASMVVNTVGIMLMRYKEDTQND